ncbi:MAG: hypothetical protein QG654_530 [Patescibacteria group bacterium]|nr:hypothetical protein [Patescibacteria group bacterium]
MKTLLVFCCDDNSTEVEAICEIEGLPELVAGDTFDLPIFAVEGVESLELGYATVTRRHWRSKRQDRIFYCSVNEQVMNNLRLHRTFVAGARIEIIKQTWVPRA